MVKKKRSFMFGRYLVFGSIAFGVSSYLHISFELETGVLKIILFVIMGVLIDPVTNFACSVVDGEVD